MTSADTLEQFIERILEHPEDEPEFFRHLLNATVYAHAPLSDDHPRLRLMQFRHPDGFMAVPFFTSEEKAAFAAQSAARIIACTGRELLEFTRGATLMLNPNDGGCVLYPEEISALLGSGDVAPIESFKLEGEQPVLVSEQANPPYWLLPLLMTHYMELGYVHSAYLLEIASPQAPEQKTLLIVLAVAPEHAERAARATFTALQQLCELHDLPLNITTFDPAEGKPEILKRGGAERFYGGPLPFEPATTPQEGG